MNKYNLKSGFLFGARLALVAVFAVIFFGIFITPANAVNDGWHIIDNATGGECSVIGNWNAESKTCTLSQDLGTGVVIDNDNLTFDGNGHTITQTGPIYSGRGVLLYQRTGVVVKNLKNITRFGIGIYLVGSNGNTLINNTSSNNEGSGIGLTNSSSKNIIANNTTNSNSFTGIEIFGGGINTLDGNIANYNRYRGINIDRAGGSILKNNRMSGNSYFSGSSSNFSVFGNSDADFDNAIDTTNLVDGKPIYYVKGAVDKVYDNSTNAGTFYCISCNNVTVKNLVFSSNSSGIFFWKTTNSHIENVSVMNSANGITLYSSDGNTLVKTTTTDNAYGIVLSSSSNNKITESTAVNNAYGITLFDSSNNTITSNTIKNNRGLGIYLFGSSIQNGFTNNLIASNASYGVLFNPSANENIFVNNTVSGSQYGIAVVSDSNDIHNNNFLDNTIQARVFRGSDNRFDIPSPIGGNYWNNYSTPAQGCIDANNDGFCDTPYIFTGGQDNLPWTKKDGWLVPANHPPTLSFPATGPYAGDGIDPNKGTTETKFSFKTVYTDADNNAPWNISLVVGDGIATTTRALAVDASAPADLRDSNYAYGEQFTATSTFSKKARYLYHFEASDGKGGTARMPATGELNFAVTNVPVIIVPGIVGSSLISQQDIFNMDYKIAASGDTLWIPDSSLPDLLPLGRIRALKMNSDGSSYNTVGVGDTIDRYKLDHFYDGLISDLVTQHGYATSTDSADLFLFPYDWRKDILLTAQSLSAKIDEIRTLTGSPAVDIVAHSQGGLVVKAYTSKKTGDVSIRKFIDIGTPHLGTPFAFKTLMWGDDLGVSFTGPGWWRELQKSTLSQAIKDAAQNMPSMYQLLPSDQYFVSSTTDRYYKDYNYYVFNPFYSTGSGKLNYDQSIDFLNTPVRNSNAKIWNQSLHQLTDNWSSQNYGIQQTVNFIGCGSATPGKILIFSGKNGMPEYGIVDINGDTRVPLRSAENLTSDNSDKKYYIPYGVYFPNGVHASLPSTGAIPEVIASILKDQNIPQNSGLAMSATDKACSFSGTGVSYHSPIDLNIYDAQGRHTGPTKDGGFENNIPGVTYDYIEDNKFAFLPDGNTYMVMGNATGLGTFDARVTTYENSEPAREYYYNEVPLTTGSTTAQFSVAPNQTDHTILVDPTGSGIFSLHVQPSSVLSASQIEDVISPITIATTSDVSGQHGWYTSNASIALAATDDNSGVLRTMYSIGGGVSWTQYTGPISITAEGSTTIQYYSIDRAGNYESPKSVNVKIDKTSPEARVSFDPTLKQLKVEGTDNLSSVVVVQNGTTYTLTDEAGHTLDIIFDPLKSEGGEIKAKIKTLMYDGSATGQLPKNMVFYEWSEGEGGALKELNQKITIEPDISIRAQYDAKKNETQIFRKDKDGNKDEYGNYENTDKPKDVLRGLVVLILNTHIGTMNVSY